MSSTPMFSTQLLGQTEKAANAILVHLLAGSGVTEPQWVALVITAMSGGAADRDALAKRVAGSQKISHAQALELLAELTDKRLLESGDDERAPVDLSDAGRRLQTRVRAATAEITGRLWGDLPAEDLAAAGRVLRTVLARANAELAAV